MSADVFLSYARADQNFVIRLAGDLKDRGLNIWLDQWNIQPGADWDRSIDRALQQSDCVVIVLSPEAVSSRQVRAEAQAAVDAGKKVVPVLYKDCEVPRVLRLYQFIDLRDDRRRVESLDRLATALDAAAEPASKPPSPSAHVTKFKVSRRLVIGGAAAGAAVLAGTGLFFAWDFDSESNLNSTSSGKLQPPSGPKGNLQVNVNVDEARVTLDGIQAGIAHQTAPLLLKGVAAGQHRIKVEADGFQRQDRTVTVPDNDWASEGFVLREQSRER